MSTATKNQITLVGGLDVGNGYLKGVVQGIETGARDQIDMPSSVMIDMKSAPEHPHQIVDLGDIVEDDFFNALDASISSRLVKTTDRHKYGRTSLATSGTQFVQFSIVDDTAKADQELYPVLVLGTLAAKALKDWAVLNPGEFPSGEIVAEVFVGLALPIREYEQHHRSFARKFTGESGVPANHVVTVRNFEEPISIRLVFSLVTVEPEGGAAQHAIADLGPRLIAEMISGNKKLGIEVAEGVTPETVHASLNTVGIDIGEGTVNFPVFTESFDGSKAEFNAGASGMLNKGYGTVMEGALRLLAGTKYKFPDRKHLADFVQRYEKNPRPQHREQYEAVAAALAKVTGPFTEELVNEYKRVVSSAGVHDVVYVYGGGAGPRWIHEALRERLDATETLVPVFYLDSQYSRNLNRRGLFLSAQKGLAAPTPAKKTAAKAAAKK